MRLHMAGPHRRRAFDGLAVLATITAGRDRATEAIAEICVSASSLVIRSP
jgi:hypothetical protein